VYPPSTVPSIYCTLHLLYPPSTVLSIYCTLHLLYPPSTVPSISTTSRKPLQCYYKTLSFSPSLSINPNFFIRHLKYRLRIFPVNSTLRFTKHDSQFSNSHLPQPMPIIILLTRIDVSFLLLQNQIRNDEQKTTHKATRCLWILVCSIPRCTE
jgi:hypothetical protein